MSKYNLNEHYWRKAIDRKKKPYHKINLKAYIINHFKLEVICTRMLVICQRVETRE